MYVLKKCVFLLIVNCKPRNIFLEKCLLRGRKMSMGCHLPVLDATVRKGDRAADSIWRGGAGAL